MTLSPLGLSECTSLEIINLPVCSTKPGISAKSFLPSISSPELSTVVLNIYLADSQHWKEMECDLRRLAKLFKTTHGGRKMVVKVRIMDMYLAEYRDRKLMPDSLEEEARIVILPITAPLWTQQQ